MQSPNFSYSSTTQRPKHRACDECRLRKLACSKEVDGCRRCRREGIACVYSDQRQMGRPRKRPRQDSGLGWRDAADAAAAAATAVAAPSLPTAAAALPVPAASTAAVAPEVAPEVDLESLHFLADQASTPGSFFNLLGLGDMDFDMELAQISNSCLPDPPPPADLAPFKGVGDIFTPMGFPPLGLGLADDGMTTATATSATSPATMTPGATESVATDPVVVTPPSVSLSDLPPDTCPLAVAVAAAPGPDALEGPGRRCSCLARLYLALDSLQTLPDDVVLALQVARKAAHAAHDTIQCENCSMMPPRLACGDTTMQPPIQLMQSLMLLGALLPTIAHAYRQILALVDMEAARAAAARQRLPLSLQAYGGVWGWLAGGDDGTWLGGSGEPRPGAKKGLEDPAAPSLETGENRLLDPHLWRLVVRALLKVDVYGIHADRDMPAYPGFGSNGGRGRWGTGRQQLPLPCPDVGDSGPLQLGLRDIVEMMAAQAKARHDSMDAAVASGMVPSAEARGYVPLPPGEKHNCQAVIDIARREIDKLVIV